MANFFFSDGTKQFGPVTAKQLKQLALEGQLLRTFLVWQEGGTKKVSAARVSGLIFNSPSTADPALSPPPLPSNEQLAAWPPASVTLTTVAQSGPSQATSRPASPPKLPPLSLGGNDDAQQIGLSPANTIQDTRLTVAATQEEEPRLTVQAPKGVNSGGSFQQTAEKLLVPVLPILTRTLHIVLIPFFFVGLVLMWKSKLWSKTAKLLWTGGALSLTCLYVWGMIRIATYDEYASTRLTVAEGDSLWEAENREAAVDKYIAAIEENHFPWRPEDELYSGRIRIFTRAIDFSASNGNDDLAKQLLERALGDNMLLPLKEPKARTLSSQVSATLEARKEQERQRSRERRQGHESFPASSSSGEGGEPVDGRSHENKSKPTKQQYESLAFQVKPGMTVQQVVDLLGPPDKVKKTDLGKLNPAKRGDELEVYQWGNSTDFIMLGFVNGRLTDGGTPGYDIHKGFHSR